MTRKARELKLWRPDPRRSRVVEGLGVVEVDLSREMDLSCEMDLSRRRGRKILLITCQSYFTILDEEKEERTSDLTK